MLILGLQFDSLSPALSSIGSDDIIVFSKSFVNCYVDSLSSMTLLFQEIAISSFSEHIPHATSFYPENCRVETISGCDSVVLNSNTASFSTIFPIFTIPSGTRELCLLPIRIC